MSWCYRTAVEQASAIRAGAVTSVALVQEYIERIERLDGPVNAVVVRCFAEALERAKAADAALARQEIWGPLHGVPITIKEHWCLKGTLSTCAIPEMGDAVADANALSVHRLLEAGVVILGKTNMAAYGADYQTDNPKYGRTNNPYDLSRVPGGSSGGSSAALASGFCALELGSDISGSLRSPAHWTGTFSHKPSYGLGHIHGSSPLATVRSLDPFPKAPINMRFDPSFHHFLAVGGPMARSCADLELSMRLLAPPVPEMAEHGWSFTLPPPKVTDVRALRVAAWLDNPVVPTDRDYLKLMHGAVESLQKAGAHVDFEARPFASEEELWESLSLFMKLLGADAPMLNFTGQELTKQEWNMLKIQQNFVKESWARFFEKFDVMLMPVMPVPAVPHTDKPHAERLFQGVGIPDFDGGGPHMMLWNFQATLADCPSTIVPVGFTETRDLPCGMAIMAPCFHDLTSIEVGKMLERLNPATKVVPPRGFEPVPTSKL